MCQQLLAKSIKQRLGCRNGRMGGQDVMAHPFFHATQLNWRRLEAGMLEPPFVPDVSWLICIHAAVILEMPARNVYFNRFSIIRSHTPFTPKMCSILNSSRRLRASISTNPTRISIRNSTLAPCPFHGRTRWWRPSAFGSWMSLVPRSAPRRTCRSTRRLNLTRRAVSPFAERLVYYSCLLLSGPLITRFLLQKKQPARTQPIPIPEHLLTTSHSVSSTTVESW